MTKKPPIFPELTADVSLTWTETELNISRTRETAALDNIHSYPETLTLALLSKDCYDKHPINDLPKNWKRFWSVESPTSGFFAAIYGNEWAKQIVLAIRGTKLTNTGALIADAAIFFGVISGQIKSSMTCIEELKKKMKSLFPGWALIITGHSLGSYLADITTFSAMYLTYDESKKAFCKRDGDVEESIEIFPYTVGFDGPGSLQMISKLRDLMDVRYGTGSRMRVEDLPADHYVGVPNIVNSVNRQVGGVYQIPMKSSKSKDFSVIGALIKSLDNLVGKIPTHLLGNFISALEGNAVALNPGNVVLNANDEALIGNDVALDGNAEALHGNFEASNRIAEALTQNVADWPSDTSELYRVNFYSTTDSRKPEDSEGPYALNRYQVEPTNLQGVELRYFSKPVQRFLHRIEKLKCYTSGLDLLLVKVPKKDKDIIASKLKSIRMDTERRLVICNDEGVNTLQLIPWLNAFYTLHLKLIDEGNFIFSFFGHLSTRQKLLQFRSDPLGLQIESMSANIPTLIEARDTSIAREEVVASLDLQNKAYLVLKTSQYIPLGKLFEKVKEKVDVVVFEKDTEIFVPPENLKVIIIKHKENGLTVNCKVDNLTDKCKDQLLSSLIDFQGAKVTLCSFVSKINDNLLPILLQGRLQQIPKLKELPTSMLYVERTLFPRVGKPAYFYEYKTSPIMALNRIHSKVFVFADLPGAGKSTVITKLCTELKTTDRYLWVIRENLCTKTKVLDRWVKKEINFEESDPVELLTELVSYEQSTTCLLRSVLKDKHSRVKISLFLDALDECTCTNSELVIEFVKQLRRVVKIKKIVISTRIYLEVKLKEHLHPDLDEELFLDEEWRLDEERLLPLPGSYKEGRLNIFSFYPFSEEEQLKYCS